MNVDRKIVGVFRTIDDAALVINELNEKGYSADNISAIAKDQKEIEVHAKTIADIIEKKLT